MDKFLTNPHNSGFWRYWLAQLISQFGDRINQMSLIGLAATVAPGSPVELAKLLAFTIIPVFIVGPVAGVFVDRWDRRTTLFVCDFLRGLIVLSIPLYLAHYNSLWYVYGAVFAVFCLSRFYVPAKMSFIPDIVDEKDLHIANSLVSVTGMIAFVVGALLGAHIVESAGPRGGFIWDANTFFISGLLVFSITRLRQVNLSRTRMVANSREMLQTIRKSVGEEMKEGIRYVLTQRKILFVMAVMTILFMAAGSIYVVIIVFVQKTFQSVTKDLGNLAVALGVGLFVGSMAYARWGGKVSKFTTIFISLIFGGVMLTVFALVVTQTRNPFVAMALAAILGCVVGPIVIAANTVVHFVCSAEMRGKVFSALEFVMHLAFLVAMVASSFLSRHVPEAAILTGVGLLFCVVGAVGWMRYRTLGDEPTAGAV